MAGTNGTALTDIQGVVASVNEHGLKLQGESDWRNFSKYAMPGAIAPVTTGTPVLVSLDKSNFVRVVSPLGAQPAPAQHAATAPSTAPSTVPASTYVDNSVRIGRQACLNTANTYLQHNSHSYTVADLLDVAGQLEAWVNR